MTSPQATGICDEFIDMGGWSGTYCKLFAGHAGQHSACYPLPTTETHWRRGGKAYGPWIDDRAVVIAHAWWPRSDTHPTTPLWP